jgi:hypothetical protein
VRCSGGGRLCAREYRSVISVDPGSAAKTFAGDFPVRQEERLWGSYRGLPSPLVVRPGAAVMAARSVPLTASAAAKETIGRDFSRPPAGIAGSLLQAKLEARNTRVEIRAAQGRSNDTAVVQLYRKHGGCTLA